MEKSGAPERIRTSGLLNRNQMLYPAELRVRLIVVVCIWGDVNNDRLQLAYKSIRSQLEINYLDT